LTDKEISAPGGDADIRHQPCSNPSFNTLAKDLTGGMGLSPAAAGGALNAADMSQGLRKSVDIIGRNQPAGTARTDQLSWSAAVISHNRNTTGQSLHHNVAVGLIPFRCIDQSAASPQLLLKLCG
jgi:hypothetical protein